MNENKLKQLFAAARQEPAPVPGTDFAPGVLRAIRQQPLRRAGDAFSIWDHLNGLFPRVALAALAVIILCVAADYGFTEAGLPGVSDGAAQVSAQYLFNSEDL